MATTFDLGLALDFLTKLSKNNNKTWFDAQRADYEAARGAFEEFITFVIDELRTSDRLQGLTAKDCVFRINRDIRFSKDKTPYKTNLAATIAPGGRKSTRLGYHISIGPNNQTYIAGGLYMPEPAQLNAFRKAVARDAAPLKKIVAARDFVKTFGQREGERLKTAPKGYEADHPEIDLLRLKQITVIHRGPDQVIASRGFPKHVVEVCRAMKPFLDYLNKVAA
jgi:uncharacterized protein (TIGR02453 family)